MSKRKEYIENYKIITEVTSEIEEYVDEVKRSDDFYKLFESFMYKYNLV
ncbi:hypothetical protein [Bacillus altitudinis]|nr:hypothetical protein [Bacillus altitudinis]